MILTLPARFWWRVANYMGPDLADADRTAMVAAADAAVAEARAALPEGAPEALLRYAGEGAMVALEYTGDTLAAIEAVLPAAMG